MAMDTATLDTPVTPVDTRTVGMAMRSTVATDMPPTAARDTSVTAITRTGRIPHTGTTKVTNTVPPARHCCR